MDDRDIVSATRMGRCAWCQKVVVTVRRSGTSEWVARHHADKMGDCAGSGLACAFIWAARPARDGIMQGGIEMEDNSVDKAVYERYVGQAEVDEKEREIQRKLEMARRFGEDIYRDGDVFGFQRTYDGARLLDYAAVKADGQWWLTGNTNTGRAMPWRQLVAWLVSGKYPVSRMWVLRRDTEVGTREQVDPWASQPVPATAPLDEEPPF